MTAALLRVTAEQLDQAPYPPASACRATSLMESESLGCQGMDRSRSRRRPALAWIHHHAHPVGHDVMQLARDPGPLIANRLRREQRALGL